MSNRCKCGHRIPEDQTICDLCRDGIRVIEIMPEPTKQKKDEEESNKDKKTEHNKQ